MLERQCRLGPERREAMLKFFKNKIRSARVYMTPDARARRHLDRSMKVFDAMYGDYWQAITPDRERAPDKAHFDAVSRDGICIIPGYVDAGTVESLQAEIAAISGFAEGRYEGPVKFRAFPKDGICGLQITEAVPTAHRLVLHDETMHALARALFGLECHLTGATVLNKYDPDRIDSATAPHWDDWRVRLKAFLYVTDVRAENAPMVYLRGSHKNVPWRREKDFASRFLPNASAGGSWGPVEALGFEKVTCTGKAGTLVIFDARGLHAGTQLKAGRRIMLMSMYSTHLPYGFRPY
jgi:hypothetical protein